MENSDIGFFEALRTLRNSGDQEGLNISFSLFPILFSIFTYIYDIVTDISVVGVHYKDGNFTYFCLTLVFIVVPAIFITCFSLRFYLNDDKKFKEIGLPRASRLQWAIRSVFLVLQIGPILRYLDVVRYGVKFLQGGPKKAFYEKYLACERNDANFLRLIEFSFEAGPQLILQLYIIVVQRNILHSKELTMTESLQLASMFGSLLAMSWILVSYHRSLRDAVSFTEDKKKIPFLHCAVPVMFLWHFFEVGTRILALGLFASEFPVSFIVLCIAHIGIMLAWIIRMKTTFCETRYEEVVYNMILSVVFLFCYLNPKDSPTRWRYLIFYTVTFVENSILMVMWYVYSDASTYKLVAMLIQFLGFAMGIMFMVIYYLLLHPTQNIHIFLQSIDSQKQQPVEEASCDSATELQATAHSLDPQEQHANCVVKKVACYSAAGLETTV